MKVANRCSNILRDLVGYQSLDFKSEISVSTVKNGKGDKKN